MIEIKKITKIYDRKNVNSGINLNLEPGDFLAIVGPNGAGKTTLIRQLMGLVKPDSGNIVIDGIDSWRNTHKILQTTAYLQGETYFYDHLKVSDHFDFFTKANKLIDLSYLSDLVDYFELDTSKKIKDLSKGNKQKVAIITTLMTKPKYIILDEPTSGLDPIMQEKFYNAVNEAKTEETIIIYCTHIISEIAKICNKIAFLKNGKIIKEENIQGLNSEQLEEMFKSLYSVGKIGVHREA
ncbi:ABC transporter ATP-binding protein [Spiroplasma endosymbiont of Aspidapion aeneum]|uniref:ABC transporter ATP-binding protein n=1 Tax=Spiroplasma endosymbiont of Aspidapion aeneum TaxID=3066276 RepID=UPI00313C2BCD